MSKKPTFADLDFGAHGTGVDGVQAKAFFPNGYGASVVRFMIEGLAGSYGSSEGLWELAVLKGAADSHEICYDTPITDDVLGHLTEDAVSQHLAAIAALPAERETAA